MADLFASGRAVDIVLAVMALEFAALIWRGKRPLDLAFALAPGACILLALRAALTGAGWPWIALWLMVSFPIHVADLVRRRL